MGTPHRGLPPPSAMTLPDPSRAPPPPLSSSLGALPAAPSQWQGAEDGMKNWLAAKAEEEKRKQEEEKTRQENLKLEQRKIEVRMLETSIQGGIPPHLVPIIFAGIGGGNLATISAEWIQSYQSTLQATQQQQQQQQHQQQQQQQQQAQAHAQAQLSPEHGRDSRLIGQPPPGAFATQQPQTPQSVLPPTAVLPGQPLPSQPQQATFSASYSSGTMSPRSRGAAGQPGHVGAPTSAPRPPPQSQLPRLTTNEIHVQQTPTAASSVQMQNTQPGQQEQASPSIYFHHWVPPTSQQDKASSSANPPATPSGKYRASPSTLARQRATSHASDPDYTSSPKKRKAQGGHQAPPPPTSAPQSYTSPSFSHVSTSSASTPGRRGHARTRSDISSRGDGHVSSVSRRTTVSSQTHPDLGPSQLRDAPEQQQQRFQSQPRGREETHGQQSESAYAPAGQRSEGRPHEQHQPQAVFHADPRSFASHQQQPQQPQPQQQQHHDRGTAPFPKWEGGDQ